MIVRVERRGAEVFFYDTDKQLEQRAPGEENRQSVIEALVEAVRTLDPERAR